MGFGRLASKIGGAISGVGRLATKASGALGTLATPLKTAVKIGGALLDPVTGGLSGKAAGIVNKGIDWAQGGGLSTIGNTLNRVGNVVSGFGS